MTNSTDLGERTAMGFQTFSDGEANPAHVEKKP
jgi:hypothetical protein